MDNANTIAERYIAVWNETDAARRRTLIRESWLEDATYVDPLMSGEGHAEIEGLISAVQARFPGFRFALISADGYGDRLRFSWKLGPADNDDMIEGTDFAIVEDGRLKEVHGFLDKVPAAA